MDTTRSYTTFPLTNIASVRSQNFRSLLRPASKMTGRNEGKSDENDWNYRQSHPNRPSFHPLVRRSCQNNNQMVFWLRLTFLCQGRCLPSPAPWATCGLTLRWVLPRQDDNFDLFTGPKGYKVKYQIQIICFLGGSRS